MKPIGFPIATTLCLAAACAFAGEPPTPTAKAAKSAIVDTATKQVAGLLPEQANTLKEGQALGVGSSRVDLQACKLEYSIVSPK